MSPYLAAHRAYHSAGPPDIPWTTALDFHLQVGIVHSDDRLFVMARRVDPTGTDAEHLSLTPFQAGDGWHVWVAAGDTGALLDFAIAHRCRLDAVISFSRIRRPRLTRYRFADLYRRFQNGNRPLLPGD